MIDRVYVYSSKTGRWHVEEANGITTKWYEGAVLETTTAGAYKIIAEDRYAQFSNSDPRIVQKYNTPVGLPSWLKITDEGVDISDKD